MSKKLHHDTIFLLLMMLVCPAVTSAKLLNDAIIAIVNNEAITLKDLKDYISGVYRQLKVENKSPQEIQDIMASYEQKGINQLVDDKLILDEAHAKGLEIRPEIVDKRLQEIKDHYSSEDQFLDALNSQGMTITDLRNKLIDQLKAKFMVDMEVRDKIFVNPEDVTQYYNAHSDEFERKTKCHLDSIYISFDKGEGVAMKRVVQARQRLVSGEDFDKISREYSEAPSIGTLEQGQMVPAIEKEVFSLKLGDISGPVKVEGGVYLFKVTGILPGRKDTLKEANDRIYQILYDQQFRQKFKAWIDKLRQKAYVEIRT